MNGILRFFEEKIAPKFMVVANNPTMKAISNGFIVASPLSIAGAFFQMLKNLPLGDWYTNFLTSSGIGEFLNIPLAVTSNITALLLAFTIAYNYAKIKAKEKGHEITAAIISVCAFLLIVPFESVFKDASGAVHVVQNVIPTSALGPQGIFAAMFVAIISTSIYMFVVNRGWTIKMPEGVPGNVATSFKGLIPGIIILVTFVLVRVGLSHTPFGTFQNLVFGLLQEPLKHLTNNIWAYLICTLLMQVLWLVGIHGPIVVFSVMAPLWAGAAAENTQALASGGVPQNIIQTSFYVMLNSFGGSGYTLPLVIFMAFFAKSKQYRTLGKLALAPSIFNINEPVIFGLPVVMNPLTAIPFVLTPIIVAVLAYILTKVGFLSVVVLSGPTQIPIFMKAIMFGGSHAVQWIIFHILALAISTVCWYPFFKMLDAQGIKQETENNSGIETA